jgi:hypothetical protein
MSQLQLIYQQFQQLTSNQSKVQFLQNLQNENLNLQINYKNLINYYLILVDIDISTSQ